MALIEHQICGTIHRLCGQGGALISADTDTDSHGVSDPSGHARGHFARAHRGRSRHVSCPDRGSGACAVGGKERRPSCWCRALTVELAARESVIGGAGGGPSLASLMPGGSARTGSGGQPRFPRSSPRSSSAVDIRRRQPGGRDAGTVARARRTQPVQVRGRWRRPRLGNLPSRARSGDRPTTVGRGLDTATCGRRWRY